MPASLRLLQHPHLLAPRLVVETEDRAVEGLRPGDVIDRDLEVLYFRHGPTLST